MPIRSWEGGEHGYVQRNEAAFDPFFWAPDFDWTLIKQTDRQCMLFFCDLILYYLCPFFAWGVYFLYGGLCCNGVSKATKDFVFPHLHSMKRVKIAC